MDLSAWLPVGALALLLPVLGAVLALLLFWVIIRSAVVSALRAHQEWLEQRERALLRSQEWKPINERR